MAGARETVPGQLVDFVRESNRIEGILRDPTTAELTAHAAFLTVQEPSTEALTDFVSIVQPGAILRDRVGLNVMVGRYFPPEGGSHIRAALIAILSDLADPYVTHQRYEALHPFTDGNGRSGRVLWLWMMGGIEKVPLGFLHQWYYQSLRAHCRIAVD